MNDKTATEPTTIEGLGLPIYLAYDAGCAGAIYLGIDRQPVRPGRDDRSAPAGH